MTAFREKDSTIEGEKIFYSFGKVDYTPAGHELKGTLSRKGWAQVVKPLRKSRAGFAQPLDEIDCDTAKFACRSVDQKERVKQGNHTAFTGYLKGSASCVVHIPYQNDPSSK